MLVPYPPLYRLMFGLLEPAGLLGGAAFAILAPNQFLHAYLGSGWFGDASRGIQAGPKGVLVASGMGTCELQCFSFWRSSSRADLCRATGMLIIGVLSTVMLPTFQKTLKSQPKLHETILRAYLGCLLVGDVSSALHRLRHR